MKESDLIDAICQILEPDIFANDSPLQFGPREMAYNMVREQTKTATREKAAKIAALLNGALHHDDIK